MRMNVGRTDRLVRVVLGVILVALGMFVAGGWIGVVIDVIGAAVWLTGIIGYSLLYRMFGEFSTADQPR